MNRGVFESPQFSAVDDAGSHDGASDIFTSLYCVWSSASARRASVAIAPQPSFLVAHPRATAIIELLGDAGVKRVPVMHGVGGFSSYRSSYNSIILASGSAAGCLASQHHEPLRRCRCDRVGQASSRCLSRERLPKHRSGQRIVRRQCSRRVSMKCLNPAWSLDASYWLPLRRRRAQSSRSGGGHA